MKIEYKGEYYEIKSSEADCFSVTGKNGELGLLASGKPNTWRLSPVNPSLNADENVFLALYAFFTLYHSYSNEVYIAADENLIRNVTLPVEINKENLSLSADRTTFWQIKEPWLVNSSPEWPLSYLRNQVIRRPPAPAPGTVLYRRWIPSLEETISFVAFDISKHIPLFHEWQNNPRVNYFWSEAGTMDAHIQYIQKMQNDPHCYSVIGYFNDQPFGYFEIYWVPEDRLAPFAQPLHAHDRGFHALVGNEKLRGPHRVPVWISSITHMLFLMDCRTQRVLLEPRIDNHKFIQYLTRENYAKRLEFNFPHKRAAMMEITRTMFFTCIGPRVQTEN
ncbi:siderophore-iron biosynthesis protein [Schizosaccharomyces japonicus yFS275]|uniref:Siderophore-iron biosynthesis protein n=1 Tax=Schizosaccharomyces japonicus (strain yFS275 / FY16936) TaxID=402676 RepID=B6JVQ4_SCHJY|nr:siderophore-iron biosynthesis protein [Schizosaccharomyces japonicus yFS275]EEB05455.1 siderophore-iron biosynthesis protein [Schizosaccharomyces japonicus yFS275]